MDGAPLRVRWPSGRTQTLERAPANTLVTAYEDPDESPDGSGFRVAPYRVDGLAARASAKPRPRPAGARLRIASNGGGAKIRLLTTMATWCETCKGELPQLALLREAFGSDELAMLGLPVDEDDGRDELDAYAEEHAPAYTLLRELSPKQRAQITEAVVGGLRIDALPASIVTDAEGRVLRTLKGVPSVSEIRRLLKDGA